MVTRREVIKHIYKNFPSITRGDYNTGVDQWNIKTGNQAIKIPRLPQSLDTRRGGIR